MACGVARPSPHRTFTLLLYSPSMFRFRSFSTISNKKIFGLSIVGSPNNSFVIEHGSPRFYLSVWPMALYSLPSLTMMSLPLLMTFLAT